MTDANKCVVLVTGGNTGLGYEIIKALLASKPDYYVFILTSRSRERATNAAKELDPTGAKVLPLELDIEDDASRDGISGEVEKRFGRVDVLINNAGEYAHKGRILHSDGLFTGASYDLEVMMGKMTVRQAWTKAYDLNTTCTHLLTHSIIPLLLKSTASAPRLIFITSGTSTLTDHHNLALMINKSPPAGWPKPPAFAVPAYRSSKTGMNMMVLEWERVLKEDRVIVHNVSPGLLATGLGGSAITPEQRMASGALHPSIGGEFVRDVVEGKWDDHRGVVVSRKGVQPW